MEIPLAASMAIGDGNLTNQIILIIILILINGFFSGSEMALVSLDRNKLEELSDEGDRKAKSILKVLDDQSNMISVIQVVITLLGFFNSAMAATGITLRLFTSLEAYGVPHAFILSQIIFTIILSYLTLLFGYLVPKRIALMKSEKIARFAVGPVRIVNFIFRPFVIILTFSMNLVLKIFGVKTKNLEGKITINDIKSMVQLGQSQGVIDDVERDMINSVIQFDETSAEEIMTPRTEVFMIDINDDFNDYKDDMLSLKYSRIPVYDEDVDNIVGLLYLKDFLLEAYTVGFEEVDITKILKEAYFVPERKNINELFSELQRNNRHMALLIDEYGGFTGIVTMEDLIEEIMGEIDDEYDEDEPEFTKLDDDTYLVKGSITIKDFNYLAGTELDEENENYDTIGGLIISELGYIPEDGETSFINIDNVGIDVLEVEDKRVKKAKITIYEDSDELNESQGEENEES